VSKPICTTPDCGKAAHARDLCKSCYGRLWRAGDLPFRPQRKLHSLSEVNVGEATAVCSICGPVKIRVRTGSRGSQCWSTIKRYQAKTQPQTTPAMRRRWKYKITDEQYAEMVEAQEGRCAICQRPDELKVDHDHSCCPGAVTCGKCIRGLLCDWCNRGLGIFRDDPGALRRASEYLGA
jgi:hypothetical protein